MTQKQILEGNKLIAIFMEFEYLEPIGVNGNKQHKLRPIFNSDFPNSLKYHFSWDWLMPVVEKIEKTNRYNEYYPDMVTIWKDCCVISDGNNGNELVRIYSGTTKIEAVWLATINFIKWYNGLETGK